MGFSERRTLGRAWKEVGNRNRKFLLGLVALQNPRAAGQGLRSMAISLWERKVGNRGGDRVLVDWLVVNRKERK